MDAGCRRRSRPSGVARRVEDRAPQLECAVGQPHDVDARPFDRDRRDARLPVEHPDAIQRDGDTIRRHDRRTVAPLDGQPVHVRIAAQLEPVVGRPLLDERNRQARGQRAAGESERRLRRQVNDVGWKLERVDVDVERRFTALRERLRRGLQREMGAVDRAFHARRDADIRCVRKRRHERHGDGQSAYLVPAVGEAIVQSDRAVLDLDVVERELRWRPRWPRGQREVHQVLNVDAAVARAREQHARPRQLDGIEHRRALPERSDRNVRDELVEGEQRTLRRLVGDHEIAHDEAQPVEIERDRFHGGRATERLGQPRLELRARNRRNRDPDGQHEERDRTGGVEQPTHPAPARCGDDRFRSGGHHRGPPFVRNSDDSILCRCDRDHDRTERDSPGMRFLRTYADKNVCFGKIRKAAQVAAASLRRPKGAARACRG